MKNPDNGMIKSKPYQDQIHNIIFEADTFWGRFFDISLLLAIIASIVVLMLESVPSIDMKYHRALVIMEWILTVLFTIEYGLRLYAVHKPWQYAKSFYGVIDLLAVLPTYLEIFVAGSHYFMILRIMRLLRVFRLFKLVRFIDERNLLAYSLRASWRRISYFLFFLLLITTVIGTLMYLLEGGTPNSKFTNIPVSIYWCVVTITTVGYGDISPVTAMGKVLASVIMILGYSIIAIPTGIVTAEMTRISRRKKQQTQVCKSCSEENHLPESQFCHRCGFILDDD